MGIQFNKNAYNLVSLYFPAHAKIGIPPALETGLILYNTGEGCVSLEEVV